MTSCLYHHRQPAHDTHVVADAQPFGSRAHKATGLSSFSVSASKRIAHRAGRCVDFARSSIAKKFALYLAVDAGGIHRSHYGFPNFYLPFITTNAAALRR